MDAWEGTIGSDIDDLEVNEAMRNEVTRSRKEMRFSLYTSVSFFTDCKLGFSAQFQTVEINREDFNTRSLCNQESVNFQSLKKDSPRYHQIMNLSN